jgi:hypothetical protein
VQVSQLLVDVDEIALEIDPLADVQACWRWMREYASAHRVTAARGDSPSVPTRRSWSSASYGTADHSAADPAEDEPAHSAFLSSLVAEDSRYRFFSASATCHTQLARYTQIDYDREWPSLPSGRATRSRQRWASAAVARPDSVSASSPSSCARAQGQAKAPAAGPLIATCATAVPGELRGETMIDNVACRIWRATAASSKRDWSRASSNCACHCRSDGWLAPVELVKKS